MLLARNEAAHLSQPYITSIQSVLIKKQLINRRASIKAIGSPKENMFAKSKC